MRTLVLPPRFTPDSNALWKAAIAAGWEVERLSSWRAPSWLIGRDLILYGEPLFAAVVAESLKIALIEPPLNWLPTIPAKYLLRDMEFMSLGKARGLRKRTFIKPAEDKCFTAAVYSDGGQLPGADVLPDTVPVLSSEPVHWEIEFRLFVLEGRVVTHSPYLRNGELAQSASGEWPADEVEISDCADLAKRLLADSEVRLPPSVVLDLGRIAGRGWAVVEVNAAWGSGIYGCDPGAVLQVVGRASVPQSKLSSEDRPWVVSWTVRDW
jgi:hypothetical protein